MEVTALYAQKKVFTLTKEFALNHVRMVFTSKMECAYHAHNTAFPAWMTSHVKSAEMECCSDKLKMISKATYENVLNNALLHITVQMESATNAKSIAKSALLPINVNLA